jgi:hypothetical protein
MSSSLVVGGLLRIVQPLASPKPVGWLARAAEVLLKPVGAVQVPSAVVHINIPTDWTLVVVFATVKVNVYLVVALEAFGLDELKVNVRLVIVSIASTPKDGTAAITIPSSITATGNNTGICFPLTRMPEY